MVVYLSKNGITIGLSVYQTCLYHYIIATAYIMTINVYPLSSIIARQQGRRAAHALFCLGAVSSLNSIYK